MFYNEISKKYNSISDRISEVDMEKNAALGAYAGKIVKGLTGTLKKVKRMKPNKGIFKGTADGKGFQGAVKGVKQTQKSAPQFIRTGVAQGAMGYGTMGAGAGALHGAIADKEKGQSRFGKIISSTGKGALVGAGVGAGIGATAGSKARDLYRMKYGK